MPAAISYGAAAVSETRDQVYRKVAWRLIPFLMLCYGFAYLDRVNVGFAKLRMSADLGLSDAVYGLGAGIFFVGYFLLEVPSNVMLHRLGARTWIARIMVSWALISGACALTAGPLSFYVLRFLLGMAEAGFFPGIILYLTYWFPAVRRGKIIAIFMVAIPLAGVVGGPLSGLVMSLSDGLLGWAGWRWMFVVEAVPALLMGCAVPFVLTSRVAGAGWLSAAEKAVILDDLEVDQRLAHRREGTLRELFADPLLLRFSAIYFCCVMGQYGITFWLPTMLTTIAKGSPLAVGLFSALPYGCAAVAMILVGWNSDRTRERRWHVALPMVLGAVALACAPLADGVVALSLPLLCVASAAILTATPLFWNLPTAALNSSAAAVGLAMINSIGNLAGFASPFLVGWISDRTGSIAAGMLTLAGVLVVGALIIVRTGLTAANPRLAEG